MQIFIPTLGRPRQQKTYHALPATLREQTRLVVRPHEALRLAQYPCIVLPEALPDGIAPTRQYILEYAARAGHERIVMCDDDLTFYRRRTDDPGKATNATEADVVQMFEALAETLSPDAPHAGVAAREGGNRLADQERVHATRMQRVLGYHVPTVVASGARFDRVAFMEDFDMTLQLLRAGLPNTVLCCWWQGQAQSNAPGGCSTQRTPERQAEAARRLEELHPAFVDVVQKVTASAWGGGERTDVRVRWKAARQAAGNHQLVLV